MMRGQAALQSMRRRGLAPDIVFVAMDDERLRAAETWHVRTPTMATLTPLRSQKPSQADLRCVVGLPVYILGADAKRVRAMRDACIRANASRVIAAVCVRSGEVFRHADISDTQGLLTWPN